MAERVHRRTVIVGGISLLAGGLLLRPRMAAAQESRPSVFPDASDQQNKQLLSAAKQFINPAYLSDSFSLGQGLVETYRGGAKVWTSAVSERAGKMQPFNIVNLYDQAGLLDETLIINADDHNRHTITLDMLPDNPFTAENPYAGYPDDLQKVGERFYVTPTLQWRRSTYFQAVPGILLAWSIGEGYEPLTRRSFETRAYEGSEDITLRVKHNVSPANS